MATNGTNLKNMF